MIEPQWNRCRTYINNQSYCLDFLEFEGLSDRKIGPPKIAFFIYRFPNARTVRRTLSELLDCIEFSQPTFNLKQTDFGIRYMHQGLLAGNYFLGMFSSTKTDMHLLQENIKTDAEEISSNLKLKF